MSTVELGLLTKALGMNASARLKDTGRDVTLCPPFQPIDAFSSTIGANDLHPVCEIPFGNIDIFHQRVEDFSLGAKEVYLRPFAVLVDERRVVPVAAKAGYEGTGNVSDNDITRRRSHPQQSRGVGYH
ncbi:hypothetical protein A4X13_0g8265 [Tilletia indica]|uniref:Uncharacterized protein n=1 Tax=Tilletia indica TaxID=43049 RepID=A0A8T8SGM0_9BASI|nr:hypothetical protein A4X13_0g8265 [Tilletia indica]